ncbi:MAG: hypothetical protein EOO38_25910, partial [Cytophagaceae bacterium]
MANAVRPEESRITSSARAGSWFWASLWSLAAYAALYQPSAAELLKRLPDIADGMAARLHKLAQNHDPALADEV